MVKAHASHQSDLGSSPGGGIKFVFTSLKESGGQNSPLGFVEEPEGVLAGIRRLMSVHFGVYSTL